MNEQDRVSELQDIDVVEVSLVGRPANMRKFLLTKNKEGKEQMVEVKDEQSFLDKLIKAIRGEPKIEPPSPAPPAGPPMDLTAKLDVLEKRAKTAEDKVAEMEKRDRSIKLAEIAKSLTGKPEETIVYLEEIFKALPGNVFDKVVAREKLLKEQLEKSTAMGEIGTSTHAPGEAGAKIDTLVKAEIAKGAKSGSAYDTVIKANPDLYKQYINETNKPAGSDSISKGGNS